MSSEGAAPEGFFIDVTGPAGFAKTVPVLAPAVSAEVAGLKNGVAYSFTVTAATREGSAAPSDAVTATPTTGVEGVVAGLIVEFTPGSEQAEGATDVPGQELVSEVDLTVAERVSDDAVLVELSEPVDVDTATRLADDLEADPGVAWAEPDQFFFTSAESTGSEHSSGELAQTVTVPTDSQYSSDQWNLWDTYGITIGDGAQEMTDAWAGPRGDGVTVAVIDTGITDHPDLVNQLVPGYDFVSNPDKLAAVRQANAPPVAFDGDYIDEAAYGALGRDANPTDPGDWRVVSPVRDSSWHGTKIAGLIAAEANEDGITGIAPNARIQPIRALSWRGGLLSDIAASITWASGGSIDGVPTNTNPSRVINMSFTVETTCPVALQDAIDGAIDRGSILVAAAGNASDDAAKFAPGNCNGVITVAATNREGQRADYSNYGEIIDIAAPGGDGANPITVTTNSGAQSPGTVTTSVTGTDSGTSLAAAHVSAAIAILASRDASLIPDQAYRTLTGNEYTKAFGNDTCDAGNPDFACGAGILALAQVAATVTDGDCVVTVSVTDGVAVDQVGTECVVTFSRRPGGTSWTVPTGGRTVEYLIVGGGGGGSPGGGGGAGGVQQASVALTQGSTHFVSVGVGGAGGVGVEGSAGTSGGSSAFGSYSALGGGGAGANSTAAKGTGQSGGSGGGGGAAITSNAGGAGTSGQGRNGGSNDITPGSYVGDGKGNFPGGGGGGAGGAGGDGQVGGIVPGNFGRGGAAGQGISSSITGASVGYAGGGAGSGYYFASPGAISSTYGGGAASADNSSDGGDGQDGKGGGGGGAVDGRVGGDGGDGIVIIRYAVKSSQTITFADPADRTYSPSAFSVAPTASSGLTVSLVSNTASICTVSGFNVTMLKSGTCSLTASQGGNSTYAAAASVTQTFVISKASQTITFADPADREFSATPFSVAPTATSGLTVSLTSNSTAVCTVSGFSLTMKTAGTCSLTATQAGNDAYAAATSVTQTFTIKAAQTITFSNPAPSGATFGDSPVSATASSTSGLAVTLVSANTGVCSVAGSSPNFTITIAGGGTCQLTASQAGDSTFAAAANVVRSFTVAKAAQSTLTVASTASTLATNQTSALSTTGGSGSGAVSFAVTSGDCSVSSTTLTADGGTGSCLITATKASDDDYLAQTGTVTVALEKAAQAALTAVATPSTLPIGQSATLSVTGGSGTGAASYVLIFGDCTLSGTTLTADADTGSCVVTATKAADDDYLVATDSVTVTLSVAPTITIVASGGDSPGSGWSLSGGVITAWQDVSIAKSNIETALGSGDLSVESLGTGGAIVVASGATITSSAVNPLTLASDSITIQGGVNLTGAGSELVLEGAAANDTNGTVAFSGSIVADELLVRNLHMAVLTSGTVTVDTVASSGGHRLLLTNSGAMTIGSVGGVNGISATEWVILATTTGDLTVAQPVGTSASGGAYRLRLTAGSSSAYGTASGGDVTVSGSGAINVPNAVTQVFSGTAAGSTGLAAIADAQEVAAVAPTVAAGEVAVAYRAGPPEFFSGTTTRYGQTLSLVAEDPTGGVVTFAAVSGPCTVTGATVTPTGVGSCVVRATGPVSGLTADQTITISQAPQTLAFTSTIPTSAVSGTTYTPVATSTSGLTAAIDISVGSPGVCSLTGGVVTINTSGTCTIRAQQAGNSNYLAAAVVTQTIVAGKINQYITFTQPADRDLDAPAFVLDATVSSGRSVAYSTSTGSVCSVDATTGVVTLLDAGDCTVSAASVGNAVYADAPTVTRTFQVVPIAPGATSVTSISFASGSLVVGFVPPGQDGGATITGYVAIATPVGGGPAIQQTCSPVSPCVIGGLADGTQYEVTLSAINSAGVGAVSLPSPRVAPASAPDAVSGLVTVPGNAQLSVEWAQPLTFGGGTFVRYEIYLRENGSSWPGTPTESIATLATESTTFTGLSNGTAYDVKVVVISTANGSELSSNTVTALGVPATVAGAPTAFTVTALSATTALAAWTAPSADGGASITGYTLSPSCTPVAATDTFCVITGLTPSSTVTVSLTADNLMGASTAVTTTVTLPAAPNPPSPSDGGESSGAGGSGTGSTPVDSLIPPGTVMRGEEPTATTVGGVPVSTVTRADAARGEREIIGTDFSLTVRTQNAQGAPVPMESGELMVPQGGSVSAVGDGYQPSSIVRVFAIPRGDASVNRVAYRSMLDGSTYLGDVTVDARGAFAAEFTVPWSVQVGEYVLQVNGLSESAEVRSVNVLMAVVAGAPDLRDGMIREAAFYEGGSNRFTTNGRAKLRTMVKSIPLAAQQVQVFVVGVATSASTEDENLDLARDRAKRIVSFMKKQGVAGEYTVTVSTTFTIDGKDRTVVVDGRGKVISGAGSDRAGAKALGLDQPMRSSSGKPLTTASVTFEAPVGT
ncbi:MAG: S8 family serine peptidase [Candidatus Nanopelagicales bacterium]|nr:S8 family serine peptidase [Candidatus Nanopelagicales bacterium]MCF8541950.1 S8 family serine peptidase [Candidatus Nanopelagicales bacterium]MCF8557757.1 S8 family serine peptidase [Candidatus Nanopelagicales bacterium]